MIMTQQVASVLHIQSQSFSMIKVTVQLTDERKVQLFSQLFISYVCVYGHSLDSRLQLPLIIRADIGQNLPQRLLCCHSLLQCSASLSVSQSLQQSGKSKIYQYQLIVFKRHLHSLSKVITLLQDLSFHVKGSNFTAGFVVQSW